MLTCGEIKSIIKLYRMKELRKLTIVFICTFLLSVIGNAQNEIPNLKLKDLNGNLKNTVEVFKEEHPKLIVFWASWCNHTKSGLNSISDDYLDDWVSDYNLKVVAITVDDSKTIDRAKTIANSSAWSFEVLMDPNGDFRRAMGVANAPYIILLDSQNKIVWQQSTFLSGDEETIEEEIKKLK